MAEEYSNRFQGEVMRLLNTLIIKVEDNTKGISVLENTTSLMRVELDEVKVGLNEVRVELNEVRVELDEVKVGLNEVRVELSEVKVNLNSLTNRVDTMSGQISGIGSKVIENDVRLTNVENEVKDLRSDIH